jgi:hypothetical protein
MAINLSRNTRLWVTTVESGWNNSNCFEIPIQEGYSLGQSVASSDVSVNEAGPVPIRGSKRFNDSLDPVEWAFSTYITPYSQGGKVYLVDMLMWQGLAVKSSVSMDFENVAKPVRGGASSFDISFAENSGHVLTNIFMYFKIDNTFYKVKGCQVGSAEISMDIADLAMVNWSGQATEIETLTVNPAFFSGAAGTYAAAGVTAGYVAIPATKKYILNKLTTMTLNAPDLLPGGTVGNSNYSIPITGASLSINNNITFVTPNTLAEVDKPVGSFTGSFEVSGSIDAYLRTSTAATGAPGAPYASADLLAHMTATTGLAKVTNASAITITLGGTTTGTPCFVITMPTAHLSVPNFSIEDVISTSIEFKGVSSNADLISGSEVSLTAKVSQA